jgi:hypothetical protein
MVFISSIDVTFSWLVSTPVLRLVALVIHIFLVVDGEWVVLMIIDDYSRSCGFCAKGICALTCFVVWMTLACFEVCLSSFDKTLGSPLQGEYCLLSLRNLEFWLLLSWVGKLVFAIRMEGEFVLLPCIIVYFIFLLHFHHTHLSHFASPVILACICLIMLIIVLGWVMRCELFC